MDGRQEGQEVSTDLEPVSVLPLPFLPAQDLCASLALLSIPSSLAQDIRLDFHVLHDTQILVLPPR